MPRSVPFSALSESFACTKCVARPCAANSFSQKRRAKKPRSSPRFSRSISHAPFSGVSWKIIPASYEKSFASRRRSRSAHPASDRRRGDVMHWSESSDGTLVVTHGSRRFERTCFALGLAALALAAVARFGGAGADRSTGLLILAGFFVAGGLLSERSRFA